MFVDQKFQSRTAERSNCALFVENSLRGHYEVGGSDQEMINIVTGFLNRLCAAPGDGKEIFAKMGYTASRAFDVDIAKLVFQWDTTEGIEGDTGKYTIYSRNPRVEEDNWQELPYFSTDIRDAWMIMEHMKRRAIKSSEGIQGSAEWRKFIGFLQHIHFWQFTGEQSALAICVCAREAVQEV